MSLQPLFPLEKQFQGKSGRNLTGGYLLVFLSGTDDPATTYSDYNGTLNPERIVLDDNGRAVVICDADLYYRLEVYDENGMLLWTEEPVACTGGGAAAAQVVTVESTDGSVDVTKTVVGSNTYFDLSTKVVMDETLDWIKASVSNISDGQVVPSFDEGTMYTTTDGIAVTAGRFYHTTTWLKVLPAGDGISYETLSVEMRLNGNTLWVKTFDIDNSLSDPVNLEVSYDLDCQEDGYVDFEVTGVSSLSSVDLSTQFHRIFNGYSSEYAKKTWVINSFVQNSSLNIQGGTITGISGTPIGGISEATVSSIASSYAESAASSKLDTSAFTSYTASALTGIQQDTATISSVVSALESSKVDQSAFDACCSAVSAQVSSLVSDVSAIQQDTADISAAVSAVTGLTGNYIDWSASGEFQPSGYYVSSDDFTAYTASALTGIQQDTADISAAVSAVTGLTGNYIDWSASGEFQPSGNYVSSDEFTAYTASALTGIQQDTADISAAVSGLTGTYIQFADLESASGFITGISGTALAGVGGHEYSGVWPIVVDNTAEMISAANKPLCVDETMTGYESAGSAVIGVNTSTVLSGLTAYQPVGDYAYNSALSGYIPTSESSKYITSLAGYATEEYVDSSVSGKQDASAMTAYQPTGDYAYNSSLSGYIPTSESSKYITSLAGYATEEYVDSSVSGKQDVSGMTAYQPAGDYQPSGDYIYESALGWAEV